GEGGWLAVGEADADGPGLTDDVQVGGDEAVGRDDEAGAEPLAAAVAAGGGDDHDGVARRRGDLLDRLGGRRPPCLVGEEASRGQEQQEWSQRWTKSRHEGCSHTVRVRQPPNETREGSLPQSGRDGSQPPVTSSRLRCMSLLRLTARPAYGAMGCGEGQAQEV